MRTLDTRNNLNRLTARVSFQHLTKAIAPHFMMLRESHELYARRLVTLTRWLIWLTVFLVILTLLLIGVAYKTVREEEMSASTQNNIFLRDQFFTPVIREMRANIEAGLPLIKEKGPYTPSELDAYLYLFDDVVLSFNNHLMTEDYLCKNFSVYVTTASNNQYFKVYISPNSGMDLLETIIKDSKNSDCHPKQLATDTSRSASTPVVPAPATTMPSGSSPK
jgi:hypothetical protein